MSTKRGQPQFRDGGGMPLIRLEASSGRYLSFAEREETALMRGTRGCARSLVRWAVTHRRSRGSCAATLPLVLVGGTIAPAWRSGSPS